MSDPAPQETEPQQPTIESSAPLPNGAPQDETQATAPSTDEQSAEQPTDSQNLPPEMPPPAQQEPRSVAQGHAESSGPEADATHANETPSRPPPGGARHVYFSPEVKVADVELAPSPGGDDDTEDLDVHNRLFKLASSANPRVKLLKEKLEAQKKIDDEREMTECTFKPSITDIAAQRGKIKWQQFLQLQNEWTQHQQKIIKAEVAKAAAENGELFEDINRKHSKKIIEYLEKQNLYKGPISGWSEHQKKLKQSCGNSNSDGLMASNNSQGDADKESGSAARRRAVSPAASLRASALHERLYNEATIREAALRVMEQTQIEKEARELFRPSTNESYWHSGTMLGARTPSSRSAMRDGDDDYYYADDSHQGSVGSRSVVDELLAKGEEYKLKREQRILEKLANPDVYTFKPETNPNSSRIILQRAEERARMMQQEEQAVEEEKRARSRESYSLGDDEDNSKKPTVKFDVDVFTSRMQRREIEKAQRIAMLRRNLKLEEVSECTFRPSISTKSNDTAERIRPAASSLPSPSIVVPKRRGANYESESYSPDYSKRAASGSVPKSSKPRGPSTASAGSQPVQRRRGVEVVTGDGDEYLKSLEEELKGVIAEWTTFSDGN